MLPITTTLTFGARFLAFPDSVSTAPHQSRSDNLFIDPSPSLAQRILKDFNHE